MRHTWLLALPLVLAACPDKGDDDDDDDDEDPADSGATTDSGDGGGDGGGGDGGSDGGDGGGGDGGEPGGLRIDCAWASGEFQLELRNGRAGGYELGWAEAIDDAYAWTGEDCGYLGYVTGDGTVYALCHPMDSSGGALVTVGSLGDLAEGATTLMSGGLELWYYLHERDSGRCYTWGEPGAREYFFDCVDLSATVACDGD